MLGQWCILSSVFREKLTQKVIIEKGSIQPGEELQKKTFWVGGTATSQLLWGQGIKQKVQPLGRILEIEELSKMVLVVGSICKEIHTYDKSSFPRNRTSPSQTIEMGDDKTTKLHSRD